MPRKIIEVYTDGSCVPTPRGPKCGYGIYYPGGELKNVAKPFVKIPLTNQRAELYAIYKAIKKIVLRIEFDEIHVYSDSMYSINCVTVWIKTWERNGWKTAAGKPVKNDDIIRKIYHILQLFPNKIHFHHVRSHTGRQDTQSVNNDMADQLANEGRMKTI